jgi:hypothetical protein
MSRKKRIILALLGVPLAGVILCALAAAVRLSTLPIEDGPGHDGSSMLTAVVIEAKNEMDGVNYEYLWLGLHHPSDMIVSQSLVQRPEQTYDVVALETPSGQTELVYFDITRFFGRW